MAAVIDKLRTWYTIAKYQYVFRKAVFGKRVVMRCRVSIKGPGRVVVGDGCRFEPDPWGDDHVTLYTHMKKAKIIIGNNVCMRATRFGSHLVIKVCDHVLLENASVFDSDFHNTDASKRDEAFNQNDRKVVIGQGAYVGCEALCSKGTELGAHAAMLPVTVSGTKSFPENTKIGGFPARKIK